MKERASLSQRAALADKLATVATRAGFAPEEFLTRGEGAWNLARQLHEAGIIDETGRPVEGPSRQTFGSQLPPPGGSRPPQAPSGDPASGIAKKALETLATELLEVKEANSRILTRMFDREVKDRYPELDKHEVSLVTTRAINEKRDFWEVAEEYRQAQGTKVVTLEQQFAKKYGLDLEALKKAQSLKEQGGGGGFALPPGKSVSFKKGADTVTPAQAAAAYLSALDGAG